MLKHAIQQCIDGRYVFCVMANDMEMQRAYRETAEYVTVAFPIARLEHTGCGKLYFDNGQIQFCTAGDPQFNWDLMKMTGAHPSCVILVDHYAVEYRFKKQIAAMHRWDHA